MQATAPSRSLDPQEGHTVGVDDAALAVVTVVALLPLPSMLIEGEEAVEGLPAPPPTAAGWGLGTTNGVLHEGHCTRLPTAESGACIDLPHCGLGQRII